MNSTYITKLSKLIAITVLTFSSSSIAEQAFEIGMGTNHGGILGGSISTEINENTEIFAGLGVTQGDGIGFVIGSKLWINNMRLIANYGYNCTVKTIGATTTYKDYNGLNVGAGYSFGGKDSSGASVDLMLTNQSDCRKAASQKSKTEIKLALGYRF